MSLVDWSKKRKPRPSLHRAVYRAQLKYVAYTAITIMAEIVCLSVRPIFMNRLLLGFRDLSIEQNKIDAIVYSVALILTALFGLLLRNATFWMVYRMGMRLRVAASGLIYKKVLSLNQKSVVNSSAGHIINLLSTDAQRFELTFMFLHYAWVGPLQALVVFYLMGEITLVPTICGATVMAVFIPMQSLMNRAYSKLKVRIAKVTDARIRMLSDVINGIKIIKLHAWESLFLALTREIRRRETHLIVFVRLCQTFQFTQLVYQVKVTTLAILLPIVLLHEGSTDPVALRSSEMFTLLSYLNALFLSLTLFLPMCIQYLFDTKVSCERIQNFLMIPELQDDRQPAVIDTDEPHIYMDNVSARWFDLPMPALKLKPTLSGISLKFVGPQLIAIVGPVGCGKSSLLQAILGELPYFEGNVVRSIRMAYMPQVAWITPGTLRQNVLISEPFDHERYWKVLRATTLNVDIENLTQGDKTQVGERGASLSGGQKARIGLARIAYSQANFLLLDDPLAAVDTRVAKHLFYQCICGFLSDRLRLLVTNQLHFLPHVDKIIIMEEGRVAEFGTYEELISKGIEFHNLGCSQPDVSVDVKEDDVKMSTEISQVVSLPNGQYWFSSTDKHASDMALSVPLAAEGERRHFSAKNRQSFAKEELQRTTRTEQETTDHLLSSQTSLRIPRTKTSPTGEFDIQSVPSLSDMTDTKRKWNPSPIPHKTASRLSIASRGSLTSRLAFSMENAVAPGIIDHVPAEFDEEHWDTIKGLEEEAEETEQAEEWQSGTISWRYYIILGRIGGGLCGVFTTIVLFVITITNYAGCDFWLTKWSGLADFRHDMNITTNVSDQIVWSMDDNRFNLIIFGLLTLALILVSTARSLVFFGVLLNSSKRLHDRMLRACLQTRLLFFESNTSGRILNRFSKDIGQVDDYLPVTIHDFLQCFFLVVSSGVVTIISSYWLVIPTVPLLVLFYLTRKYYLRASRDLKRMESVARSPVFSWVNVTLQGLPCIRAARCEDYQIRTYNDLVDEHTSIFFMNIAAARWLSVRLDLLCAVFITCVAAVCLLLGIFSNIPAADVGLMITYAVSLVGLFQWCIRQSAEVENQMVSVERAVEYMDLEPEITQPPITEPPDDWPKFGRIVFDNLWLRYHESASWALKGISLDIVAGLKVGVVGRTGAGKSSLISALFRLVETQEGKLMVDGIDVAHVELKELRRRISIIPQDPIMFSGTIRSNLDPDHRLEDSAIWDALSSVQLNRVVSGLPGKLDFHVSEGGTNFSTGQRQLLALARAILGGNRIIVVDEATANVDPYTDAIIQKTLRSQFAFCTVMTVAHRLHTVIDNDLMVVMEDGRIVEVGVPHELLNPELSSQDKQALGSGAQPMVTTKLDAQKPVSGQGPLADLVKHTSLEESVLLAQLARDAYCKTLTRFVLSKL
ncbi:hypothetical protein CRM22_001004 [Opisthorchis felineus]|uniref:Uncharacterized protein n=1 Tax=Opisthorchis felineus TaxID=147828 RepID=A0A4S2MJ65_OPIFE|nr:hypothetical protein CRM22_001004 [Opisthorchis felineus]